MRGPETGLVTLRGRIGGGGAPFNFGEATVTRATVRLPGGAIGHAYALGRDKAKARLCAIADALSMGASGYLAAKSEAEVSARQVAIEKEELRLMPDLEEKELAKIQVEIGKQVLAAMQKKEGVRGI